MEGQPLLPGGGGSGNLKFGKGTFGSKENKTPILLSWKNVSCALDDVSGPPCRREVNRKQILSDVSGYAQPGTLTAIIGSSGAGKSTLLDILSGRKNLGEVDGEILMNGKQRNSSFKRFSAYVTQEDTLLPTLTVYETLMFAVSLGVERDPNLSSAERDVERDSQVLDMVHELGLEKTIHSRVGDDEKRGISGGEKKRLSIGCEMIADPSLLFLDEPTTGLDAYNSHQVVLTLKKLANAGRTVICTLHQPRSSIFALFDNLCCLSEGRVVYFGPGTGAVPYFEAEILEKCSPFYNPADYIIDLALEDERRRYALKNNKEVPLRHDGQEISNGGGRLVGDNSLADVYAESEMNRSQISELDKLASSGFQNFAESSNEKSDFSVDAEPFAADVSRFAVSWPYQLAYLIQRQMRHMTRTPQTSIAVLIQATIMSLFVGSLYHGTLNDESIAPFVRVQNRMGALFFCLTNLAFGQMQALLQFVNGRSLFLKEKAAGLYRISAYYLSKTLADLPSLLVAPLIFCTIAYWLIGFQPKFVKFLIFFAIIFIFINTMVSFFVFVGCLTTNPQAAQMIASLGTVIFFLFAGFYITTDTIPDYYIWLEHISPFKYGYAALLENEFIGLEICFQDDTTSSGECIDGEVLLFGDGTSDGQASYLGDNSLRIPGNLGVLVGMTVFYRILGYICLRAFFNQER
eukprot:CAMPEP_0201510384 /NCGR_PEP_ID=MMETSP0161_2-20130828/3093_1 /ASSEMBLY_ACC=CAM_ASM_000251 /TAXON_ID=180227 /ORGANISM="Neoparamoeba aestuarina, Strain SoJaBio B1-5/56/2" /LENGTH=688 /DNA_ID=CAMNT_0047905545 /DNA_START=21 /DNA_END=2087 /DNA_ORIENTATION=-